MGFVRYIKYGIRFLFLQILLTFFTIFYFDRFLIGDYFDGYLIIRDNLLEDRDRFYPFISNDLIKTDFDQKAWAKLIKNKLLQAKEYLDG